MKAAVIGAGSLGSLLAWQLAAAGAATAVTVAVRRQDHAGALNRDGLTLIDPANRNLGARYVRVVTRQDAMETQDVVFVTTKAYDVSRAVLDFRRLIGPHAAVVCLQNGIGSSDDVRASLEPGGMPPAVRAVTSNGAMRIADTVVRMGGQGPTYLGSTPGCLGAGQAAARVGHLLRSAGWEAQLVEDISPFLWGKLLVNAGINPITALLGRPNGFLVSNADAAAASRLTVSEAARVSEAMGVRLPWPDPAAETLRVAEHTATNRSSMLQDLDANRRTEIDYINGAVIRYGAEVGVDTPFNRLLTMLVRARETGLPEEVRGN